MMSHENSKSADQFTPATPRDAAAVILVRDDRILWARRNPAIEFLGGFHAFPGGKVDSGDFGIAVSSSVNEELSALLVCAVREVFEEVGVLLTRGGEKLTKGQRASLHDDLISGRSPFREILDNWGLRIDASDFVYTGFWTTPPFSHVRFKTRFFLARCPARQEPFPAISELENIEFIKPAEALDRWRRSEVLISPPVLVSLQGLDGFGAVPDETATELVARGAVLREMSEACAGEIGHVELNPRTICIPLRTKTLPPATHTNCFIVGIGRFAVIDAASPFPDEQARLATLVDRLICDGGKCEAIIVSHLHKDHIGGETALRTHLDQVHGCRVPLVAHARTASDLAGTVMFDGLLGDGDQLRLEDREGTRFALDVLHTPGHARGHLAFYDSEMRFLLSGDNVVGTGTVVIAPPQGNMTDYLGSLERMRDLSGLRFLAGSHGAATYDARGRIAGYIAHRLGRERQIAGVLETGVRDPSAIAGIVYSGLDERLMPLAVKTVEAHLERLDESDL